METAKKIKIFYNENQSVSEGTMKGVSKSPEKPAQLLDYLEKKNLLLNNFEIESNFAPFNQEDFMKAHSAEYVFSFFEGITPLCNSNGLQWSPQLANSVRYTNASLYNAIRTTYLNPLQVSLAPASGFHHAMPHAGSAFCSFSGQVIASSKIV